MEPKRQKTSTISKPKAVLRDSNSLPQQQSIAYLFASAAGKTGKKVVQDSIVQAPAPAPSPALALAKKAVEKEEADKENGEENDILVKQDIICEESVKIDSAVAPASKPAKQTRKRQHDESSSDTDTNQKVAPLLISNTPIEFQSVSVQEPAYRKFAPLLQTYSKSGLPLPPTYQKLMKLFVGVETVLNYLKSRNTTAVFHKIMKSVEHQAGCSFSVDLFSQIVAVYPEGFKLASLGVTINDEKVQTFTIDLPVDHVAEKFLESLDRTAQGVTHGPRATVKVDILEQKGSMMGAIKKMADQTLIRRLEFQKRLEDRIHALHKVFLEEKGLEWTMSATNPKWHPDFNLATVPAIEKAALPIKKAISYLEALKKKSASFSTLLQKDPFDYDGPRPDDKKTDDGLLTLAPSNTTATSSSSSALGLNAEGKPLSRAQALLERVREKQRLKEAKALANPKETPEMVKRRSMLCRIRSIASSLSLHVKTNGKSVLSIPDAICHLRLSFPNYYLNSAQWYEHIDMLVETVPAFCSKEVMVKCAHLKTLQSQHYLLRFHDNVRIKVVADKVDELTKQIA